MSFNYFASGFCLGVGLMFFLLDLPAVGAFNLFVSLVNFILARLGAPQK